MVRLGRILAFIAVLSLVFPLACAEEQELEIEDPRDSLAEILQLTDEQLEQMDAGTGTLHLREDQVDTLSDYVTQLLEDLQPWLDEAQWQEVKGILEAMLAQGEIDLQTLDPVAEAIHDSLISEAEASVGVYTNLVKLPTELTATMREESQLAEGSQLSDVVILYTPEYSSVSDRDYEPGVERRALSCRGGESIANADEYSGVIRVYTDAAIMGGARASALQRIRINVPVDGTDITITSKLLYTSGAATALPPPFGTAATRIVTVPLYDSQPPEESYQVIDPLFGWKDAVSLGLLIVSAGMSSVPISLAVAATSGILTIDDISSYVDALKDDGEEEIVVYSADSLAAGDYVFEIGVWAETVAVIDVARAFVFGMVPEIEVTLTFGEEEAVTFPDPNLEAAIREAIGKPTGDIYPSDLAGLTALDASESSIADLTGIEYCTNLLELYLYINQIGDISPLANLSSLIHLNLCENPIGDISPLTNLTNLEFLLLFDTQISDISPLANLTSLTALDLENNQISNILPLANLTSLTGLFLGNNPVSDISSLANLTSLKSFSLHGNQINDISLLANFTNLTGLYLGNNQVSDISSLANLTSLTRLDLENNQISDISALVDNEGLSEGDEVFLTGNPLNADSINIYIPELEARGVIVDY